MNRIIAHETCVENYRPTNHATAFSVIRESIQKSSSNLRFPPT